MSDDDWGETMSNSPSGLATMARTILRVSLEYNAALFMGTILGFFMGVMFGAYVCL